MEGLEETCEVKIELAPKNTMKYNNKFSLSAFHLYFFMLFRLSTLHITLSFSYTLLKYYIDILLLSHIIFSSFSIGHGRDQNMVEGALSLEVSQCIVSTCGGTFKVWIHRKNLGMKERLNTKLSKLCNAGYERRKKTYILWGSCWVHSNIYMHLL